MTTASGMSTVKSKNTTKAGLAVETMSAPNPFCPNTKGVCCLMVLTNLSLILICIGFIIVLQLTDPPVVWSVNKYVHPSPEKGYTSTSGSIIFTKATF